jgi:hypothetical protein
VNGPSPCLFVGAPPLVDSNFQFYVTGAFFDMYIGDIPVSEQTKEEIGKNVACIIGKC